MIAVDETSDNDAVRALQVAQRQMELVQEEAQRVAREEEKRGQEDLGGRLECRRIVVSLQQALRRIGTRKAQLELEEAARRADERCPVETQALSVPTNEPLSMFDARTWPASLVEFFYGDCAPFLDSEVPLTCEEVFASLLVREELEYSLPDDDVPYKARTQNRWSTPEVVALFADVRRRLATLAGARATFRRKGFTETVKKVAEARAEDFVTAASLVGASGGTREALAHPEVHNNVKEALRALTTSTMKVPGTEGHKTMLRHLGHAMNLIFGPATVFTTANYPDVRTGLVALLDDGPAPAGKSPAVDLLRDDPAVPSVVDLHRILARNPVAGARYFLLMQELNYRHCMGFDRLWLGRESVAKHRFGDREDGYACST